MLAALAAALQSSHDVDPEQLHGNASASAAALRARQQEAPPAKPRWGVTGVHSGSSGHANTAGIGSETDPTSGAGSARDEGLAADNTEGIVMHGGSDATDRLVHWSPVHQCQACRSISISDSTDMAIMRTSAPLLMA